jgi:hypothetical protein
MSSEESKRTVESRTSVVQRDGKHDRAAYAERPTSTNPDSGTSPNSASGNQTPVDKGIVDYVHVGSRKSLLNKNNPYLEVAVIQEEFPPIDIYFYEMSAMLGPALINPTDNAPAQYLKEISSFTALGKGAKVSKGGKYAWRYMSISTNNHTNLSYDDNGHYKSAYGDTIQGISIGKIMAKWDARKAKEVNDYIRRAVSNGITYHTETSWGHYVRNCPHFCWPELKRLQNPAENMVFEMVPWTGPADANPKTHPQYAITWAHLNRVSGLLPSGIVPRGDSEADKKKRVEIAERYRYSLLRHRRVDFYEHRSSVREDKVDGQGSWWWRRYISDKTRAPVNMCEFSQYDIRMYAGFADTYGPSEYWYPHYANTDQYKYFMSIPSWNIFQKKTLKANETDEEAKQRQWEDLQAYIEACKKGAKPGRVVKIQMRLPPGRYIPKIYGETRSYSYFPLDLCKQEGDHTQNSPFLQQQEKPEDKKPLFTGDYYPFSNPIPWSQAQTVSTNVYRGLQGMDYWKHKGNTNPEYTQADRWNWPVDEKQIDLNWWDLFKITEGVGDGFKKGDAMWKSYWEASPLKDMNKHYGFGIRKLSGGSTRDKDDHKPDDNCEQPTVVPGDVPANDSIGKEIPFWYIDVTKEKRPVEIHFFAASRAVKWIKCTLGGVTGTVEKRELRYTFGPTDWRHIRIKGPHSLYLQHMKRWPMSSSYYYLEACLMPTAPDALAWIVEIVYSDGSRTAVTIWCKVSLAPYNLAFIQGGQDPLENAMDFVNQQLEDSQTNTALSFGW